MRLRNNLLALAILLVFLAFGTLYVRFWVVQRPFGIILFVSDGLVARHLTAARLYADGAAHRLELERHFPHSALVRNDSTQFAVADAASIAPFLASGPAQTPTVASGDRTLHLSDLDPAQRKSLPPLKLSMNMWNDEPTQRFVILDGNRLREGDRIGDAVVTAITREGVVLDWEGRRLCWTAGFQFGAAKGGR